MAVQKSGGESSGSPGGTGSGWRSVAHYTSPRLPTPATCGQQVTQPFSAVTLSVLLLDCWPGVAMCHHQVFSSDNGGFGTLALQEWQCYTLPVDSHAEALRQQ